MKGAITLDEYRTGYISERHGVSVNCARALQLFEIGFSAPAASRILGVSESTGKSYMRQLTEAVGDSACWSIGGKKPPLDVWGKRDVSEYGDYDFEDGVRHAQERANESVPVTESAEQLDPQYREQPPLNGGKHVSKIDPSLMSLGYEVDV